MKRLLILTAIAMMSAGTLGCQGMRRSWFPGGSTSCYAPCPTASGCSTCGDGAVYGDVSTIPEAVEVMPGPVTN